MVNLTRTPEQVLMPGGNVSASQLAQLFNEYGAAIDGSGLARVVQSGGNVTVGSSDMGTVFAQTAASTVTLPELETVPEGFAVLIRADGGAVTVRAFGSEVINGAANQVIPIGEGGTAFAGDGSWYMLVTQGPGAFGEAAALDAPSEADLDIQPGDVALRGIVKAAIGDTVSQALASFDDRQWSDNLINNGRLMNTRYQNASPFAMQLFVEQASSSSITTVLVSNDGTTFDQVGQASNARGRSLYPMIPAGGSYELVGATPQVLREFAQS